MPRNEPMNRELVELHASRFRAMGFRVVPVSDEILCHNFGEYRVNLSDTGITFNGIFWLPLDVKFEEVLGQMSRARYYERKEFNLDER